MAKCISTKEVMLVPKEVDVYQLTLSKEEAKALHDIIRRVGGVSVGRRKHIQAIEDAMDHLCVPYTDRAPDIDRERYNTIHFIA